MSALRLGNGQIASKVKDAHLSLKRCVSFSIHLALKLYHSGALTAAARFTTFAGHRKRNADYRLRLKQNGTRHVGTGVNLTGVTEDNGRFRHCHLPIPHFYRAVIQ